MSHNNISIKAKYIRSLISISAHDQNRYPLDHSSACRKSLIVQSLHVKSGGNLTWNRCAVTSLRTKSVPPTDGVKSKTGRSKWSNNCNRNPPFKNKRGNYMKYALAINAFFFVISFKRMVHIALNVQTFALEQFAPHVLWKSYTTKLKKKFII